MAYACGYRKALAVYGHGNLVPLRVFSYPREVDDLPYIGTDMRRYLVITDERTKSVLVVDLYGNLHHTIKIDTKEIILDCAVVNRQLWVPCDNGEVVIMSASSS